MDHDLPGVKSKVGHNFWVSLRYLLNLQPFASRMMRFAQAVLIPSLYTLIDSSGRLPAVTLSVLVGCTTLERSNSEAFDGRGGLPLASQLHSSHCRQTAPRPGSLPPESPP